MGRQTFSEQWDSEGGPSRWQQLVISRPTVAALLPTIPILVWALYVGFADGLTSNSFIVYGTAFVVFFLVLKLATAKASRRMEGEHQEWVSRRDSA
jgi:hypothetical protein